MGKNFIELMEKGTFTFMVSFLDDLPYLFLASPTKRIKVNGKEFLAFPSSDRNIELALSADPRIYGLSILSEEKKLIRFAGKGLIEKGKELLMRFGKDKPEDFIVLLKIENFKEENSL